MANSGNIEKDWGAETTQNQDAEYQISNNKSKKAYKGKDKEVKKSVRNDMRSYVEGLAAEAESAAASGEMSTV